MTYVLKISGLVKISELDVGRWRVRSPFLLDDLPELVPPQISLTRWAETGNLVFRDSKLSYSKRCCLQLTSL